MSRFTCFIIPFNDDGLYGEAVDVTNDVDMSSLSTIRREVDQNQYNVGVLTYGEFNLKLRNEHGRYSTPEVFESIFRLKRAGSIFQVFWQLQDEGPYCGIAVCGEEYLSESIKVFEGLITDEATRDNINNRHTSFNVLSMESLLSKIEVPFSSLLLADTFSQLIYKILNQADVTSLITVDVANFSLGYDVAADNINSFEKMTGKEALDELLKVSNSILYIKDRIIYIKSRVASASILYNFYGPMSIAGLENIQQLSDIRTGLAQTFNYLTWRGETFSIEEADSIALYGVRKKEFSSDLLTNLAKRQAVLTSYINEFGVPKKNLRIKTPLTYEALALFFLDKVVIDFPTIYATGEGKDLPIYDSAIYDEASYAIPESLLTISPDTQWKILSSAIEMQNQILEFQLKEI